MIAALLQTEDERGTLRALFMQAPAAIAVLREPEHRFTLVNRFFSAMTGGRAALGMNIRQALPELEGQGLFEALDRAYRSGEAFAGTEVPMHIDRTGTGAIEVGYFNLAYQPIRGAHGLSEGILVFAVDVTEQTVARKRIEEAATERQALFEARERAEQQAQRIFDLSFDLLATSRGGYFLRVNPAFESVLGWSQEELLAIPIEELVHPEDAQATRARREETRHGATLRGYEARYRHKDGSYRWLSWNATSEGESTYAVGRDVTDERAVREARARLYEEQRAAKEAAETATRAMDQFLGMVSHELRTPLNAMLGWTRLLRGENFPEARRARALETIERNALAQTRLIEDLLDVSRIISGKMRLELALVDLEAVIEAAVDVVRPAADAKDVRLHALFDSSASHVVGDSSRLQQIVWNLLANAVKFTPRKGSVELQLKCVDSFVEIAVADSGVGIAPDFLGHVFEPFRQADGATTRAHGGLGLGLAIVKNLVELHGGTVTVESPGLGLGATFRVRLPVSLIRPNPALAFQEQPPRAERTSSFEVPAEIVGLRVLVVDDEPDARELLVTLLAQAGAIVSSASSVSEAMEALGRARVDVVLSDIGMPEEDGYALVRKIRALPTAVGGRVVVIALTAYARLEDRTSALRAGFNTHLAKPVDPAELMVVIASAVARTSDPSLR